MSKALREFKQFIKKNVDDLSNYEIKLAKRAWRGNEVFTEV